MGGVLRLNGLKVFKDVLFSWFENNNLARNTPTPRCAAVGAFKRSAEPRTGLAATITQLLLEPRVLRK